MKSRWFLSAAAVAVAILPFVSCDKGGNSVFSFRSGNRVTFSAGAAGSGDALTRAVYSDVIYTENAKRYERIDWQQGDLIRVSCAQASEPASKYADYVVGEVWNEGNRYSYGRINPADQGSVLCWGAQGQHVFYGVYPAPASGMVTVEYNGGSTARGSVPAVQPQLGFQNHVVKPDLPASMMMVAKNIITPDNTDANYAVNGNGVTNGDDVFLSFDPLTTAIQFTITNKTGRVLPVSSVGLISDANAINGPFTANIDNVKSGTAPYCAFDGTVSESNKSVSIDLSGYNISLAVDETLQFTFFLTPTATTVDDLTFTITDPSSGKTRMLELRMANGTKLPFPTHKKSFVTGIFVPEGVQWTVKYDAEVISWEDVHEPIYLEKNYGDEIVIMDLGGWVFPSDGTNAGIQGSTGKYLPGDPYVNGEQMGVVLQSQYNSQKWIRLYTRQSMTDNEVSEGDLLRLYINSSFRQPVPGDPDYMLNDALTFSVLLGTYNDYYDWRNFYNGQLNSAAYFGDDYDPDSQDFWQSEDWENEFPIEIPVTATLAERLKDGDLIVENSTGMRLFRISLVKGSGSDN